MNTLTISPSPHIHGGDSVKKNMYGVIIALIPTLAISIYNFGLGAIVVTATAVATCLLFEHIVQIYLLKKPKTTIWDGSAIITGLLLAFNVPSNLPIAVVVIGSIVAIGVGKLSFGGLGNNPFNPALVGRVFLFISFPTQMTTWPQIVERTHRFLSYTDVVTGATPLAVMKEQISSGHLPDQIISSGSIPSYRDMFLGLQGGSMGEMAGLAIILGLAFMLYRKIITWHIPAAIIATAVVFTGILHWADADKFAPPMFHLLSGGLLLGAVFMATDYSSSPMTNKGGLIFGFGIGLITILIRTFGSYPEGISFAILIMNAFVPLIDKYVKPKRFGEKIKLAKA